MSERDDPGGDIDFLAELPEQVVYLLYQVHRRRESSLGEALETAGLPLATWRMLLSLQRMQPCTMNALARFTTVERSALTRILDQLVEQGLAMRSTPPEDRRKVLVNLTDAGMAAFEKGHHIVTSWNSKALAGVSRERLESLRENLAAVVCSMLPDQKLAEDIVTFNHRARAND